MQSNPQLVVDPLNKAEALISRNLEWLDQALALLEQITDEQFTRSPAGLEPHRVGPHLRHVLEFYECFLAGLPTGHIDYDQRARDERIEQSRGFAMSRIREIQRRLPPAIVGYEDAPLLVCMEDAATTGVAAPWLTSSLARELQVLASHTTHHYALISMTLRALGVAVEPHFGMAPATLSHRRRPQTARAS